MICLLLLVYVLCINAIAFAAVDDSPLPVSAADELIKYGSTGERIVRIQIRLRELGYFNFKPTGNYQNMTVECARRFQQLQLDENGQAIIADGTIGAQSMSLLFSKTAKRNDIDAAIPFGPPLTGTPTITGTTVGWDELKPKLMQNKQYLFTDYNTGNTFYMTLANADNHAEMECSTAEDTAMFLSCFGGAFNFSKRPMVMHLDNTLIAASMQGEPHGEDTIPGNSMEGHVCVYFTGSTSNVGSLPDVEHMNQIRNAAGQ